MRGNSLLRVLAPSKRPVAFGGATGAPVLAPAATVAALRPVARSAPPALPNLSAILLQSNLRGLPFLSYCVPYSPQPAVIVRSNLLKTHPVIRPVKEN